MKTSMSFENTKLKGYIFLLLFLSCLVVSAQTTITFDDQGWSNADNITDDLKNVNGFAFRYFVSGTEQTASGSHHITYDVNNGFGGSGAIYPDFDLGSGFSIAKKDGTSFELQSFYAEGGFGSSNGFNITGYSGGVSTGTQSVSTLGFGVGTTVNLNTNFDNVDSVFIDDNGGGSGFDVLFDHFTYGAAVGGSTPVSASISAQSNVSCNGAGDGSLTATATDGTANFDYQWSNTSSTLNTSSTTNTISSLSAGTYTVTITDDDGNTSTASATITEPSALAAGTVKLE